MIAQVALWGLANAAPLPPPLHLEADLRARLTAGESLTQRGHGEDEEWGLSATLVRAEPADVWTHIRDFDRYVEFLPYITGSKTLAVGSDSEGPFVRAWLELTTRRIPTQYLLEHRQMGDFAWFGLRSSSGSPIPFAEGWWTLSPWPEDPTRHLLTWQVRVQTSWFVPSSFKRRATELGLQRVAPLLAARAEGRR